MSIVSFFDQFPEYNGQSVEIRSIDGYVSATDLNKILKKRFTDWRRTKTAQDALQELSRIYRTPVDWAKSHSQRQKPLVDYIRGGRASMFIHPTVAIAYCMSDGVFLARVSAWMYNTAQYGTATPHWQDWTAMEYLRGVEFNRDDINDMYG
jgi:hypothetical protein